MARPSPEVIEQVELGTGAVWQILAAESYFVITYQGQPINLRVINYNMAGPYYKYKKLTYTSLGNAQAQARTLNHRFKCQDFDVVEVNT